MSFLRAVPKLLVSVRNADEAEAALIGGCDIIDIKEPLRGPLGMADPDTIMSVVRRVTSWNFENRRHVPTSIALGDADDWGRAAAPVLPAAEYVKLGTAGLSGKGWAERWKQAMTHAIAHSGGSPQKIVVAYADWLNASAPSIAHVVAGAAALGCAGVLIDTFAKSRTWLGDELSLGQILQLQREAHKQGLQFALAGGLQLDRLEFLAPLQPDIIGIRGAACEENDRTSAVAAERVALFRSVLGD